MHVTFCFILTVAGDHCPFWIHCYVLGVNSTAGWRHAAREEISDGSGL